MSENAKDYALIQDCLEDLGLTDALAAIYRIKQNREWEVLRAVKRGRAEALAQAAEIARKVNDDFEEYRKRVSSSVAASLAFQNRIIGAAQVEHAIREASRRPS